MGDFGSKAGALAPAALDRLGKARTLVDALLGEVEAAGPRSVIDDLGWRWPGWASVSMDPMGFGIAVGFGAEDAIDPAAPVLRPLSAPSASRTRVLGGWVDARWSVVGGGALEAATRTRLLRALGQVLARHPRVRAWEHQGTAALAIPPAVLRLARVIERCQPRAAHRLLRARSLDVAWRHYPALRRARDENPALFPLLGAYAAEHGLRAGTDPVRQLREWCRFRGLSKAEWARLTRNGTSDCTWALRLVGDRVSHLDLVIGMVRIERALGRPLGEFDGDLRIRWLVNTDPWRCRPEVEYAVRLYARTGATLDQATPILGLLHDGLDAGLVTSAEVLASRGWRALEARIVRSVLQRAHEVHGDPRFEALAAIGRFEREQTTVAWLQSLAVPATALVAQRLVTDDELAIEGEAMRNCVGGYADRVRRGRYLVYAIRGREGQPVATVGFRRSPGKHAKDTLWKIDQLAGIADRPAPASAQRFATLLLAACNGPEGPPDRLAAPPTIGSGAEGDGKDGGPVAD